MDEGVGLKNKTRVPDLYGTVTLAERNDGYFYVSQPRDPEDWDEKDDRIAFSRETAAKLHAELGAWLKSS